MKSGTLEDWRSYFRTASSPDVFEIIYKAIEVAASDFPKEFRSRRDRIAEHLFCCRLTRCSGCHRVQLSVPENDDPSNNQHDDADDEKKKKEEEVEEEEKREKEELMSKYSYGEAEALSDEMEEASQVVGEVFRIKELLLNFHDQSESVLFESLRRLQLMALTVDTLKVTEIGKAVNGLRKHGSKDIKHLACALIDGWKELVDEWYRATQSIKVEEGTPESINPSTIEDEEGLPSPPLDEGVFFATQTTGIELSGFFDGMDDYENPPICGEFMKNHEKERKPPAVNHNTTRRKQHPPNDTDARAKDNKSQPLKREVAADKPNKPSNTISGPGRPLKQNNEQKVKNEPSSQQRVDKMTSQMKPLGSQQEKFKCSDEVAVRRKLEATKRKLQESYQQAKDAKKQRTIQVMELHDLPKQRPVQKNPQMKSGNFNRHWAHGRR